MAGFFGSVKNSKANKSFKTPPTNEMVAEYQHSGTPKTDSRPAAPSKFSLSGILGLNQTVELGKSEKSGWGKELFGSINHLEQEEKMLFDSRQKELQKAIDELRSEIQQLIKVTEGLDTQIEKVSLDPIVEPTQYQITYFERIKNFIANFRKNVSEASHWVEAVSARKKKKNYFWNTVKNKKAGGEQYLFSNEHSVARSGS